MALLEQLQALPSQWQTMLQERIVPLRNAFDQILERAGNPVKASFDLGCKLMEQGKFEEARLRFKFVLWRQPTNARAWYNMAICYFARHQTYDGLQALNKSLIFDKNDEMALYLKASYEKGRYADNYSPHTTPPAMVRAEFSSLAPFYNASELAMNYCGHEEISHQLIELNVKSATILDAGCGTGLCGPLLKLHAEKLIGIDLTREMLEIAKDAEIQLYDELIMVDLRDYLLQCTEPRYDVIVSSNVMPIVGGLAPVMDGAVKALKPGGYFIFSTYALEAMEGYRFINELSRFAHSSQYLKSQIERVGLKPISLYESPLYKEDKRPAYLVVLQK